MNFKEYGPIISAALKLNNTVYTGKTHAHCFEDMHKKKYPMKN